MEPVVICSLCSDKVLHLKVGRDYDNLSSASKSLIADAVWLGTNSIVFLVSAMKGMLTACPLRHSECNLVQEKGRCL